MGLVANRIKKIIQISIIKTLYFNFHYFPIRMALHLPVFITKNVYLIKGSILLKNQIEMGQVRIGFDCVGTFDFKKSRSIWQVEGEVIFGGKAELGHGTKISVAKTGILEFGDNIVITAESSIITSTKITFGTNCLLSWDILCMDTDFHRIIHDDKIVNYPRAICIGNEVWIGCRSTLLKGCYIADGCVIGANSVVTGKLDSANSIYSGNPVKKKKENIRWEE